MVAYLIVIAALICLIIILLFKLRNRDKIIKKNVEQQYAFLSDAGVVSKVWKKFAEYSLIILFFFGVLLIATYFINKKQNYFDQGTNKDIFSIGLAITSSGVFLAALKWFQFMGFFREELQKIIKSSEFENNLHTAVSNVVYSDSFLANQKDLPTLWSRVNKLLFKNEFTEEIADKIETKIQQLFFHNSKLSHYYKNFSFIVNIDLEGDSLIIREITEVKVVRTSDDKFKFDFNFFITKSSPGDTDSSIDVKEIIIDNTPQDTGKIVESVDGNNIRKTLWVELEGKCVYNIYTDATLRYNINTDREYEFFAERFIDDLRVDVTFSDKLQVIFTSFGLEEFKGIPTSIENQITRKYSDILLPEKGFKLIFVKNNF
jgi:hypothetical protein